MKNESFMQILRFMANRAVARIWGLEEARLFFRFGEGAILFSDLGQGGTRLFMNKVVKNRIFEQN